MRTAQVTDNGVQDMIQTMPESLQGFILNPDSTDGKIIFALSAADGVGAFDHADESFQLIDISPMNAEGVGIFDPADDSFYPVDISAKLKYPTAGRRI